VGDREEAEVRTAVAEARRLQTESVPPPPLVDSPKCPRCSLAGICLPDETNALLSSSETEHVTEPETRAKPVRRLIPPDDERAPIYVMTPGTTLGKKGELIEVRVRDAPTTTVRLGDVSHVNVFGAVQLTHGLIQEFCRREIGVSFFSGGGWYYGALGGVATVNVQTRIAQFRTAADPASALALARSFIASKILNGRTIVRRNADEAPPETLDRLRSLAEQAKGAQSVESLLGIEGLAARLYFAEFAKLLSPRSGSTAAFDFDGRNRRPPKDPVNALLSFAYSLLLRDVRVALIAAGFDPTVGFFHQPRPGRPGLALDLMEEFRPLLADSAVLTAVNTEVVGEGDFVRAGGAVALTDKGRKAFTGAYERRIGQEVTHPIFGYRIDYRRILQVQARLLARAATGEIPRYPGFETR
jgi:CRISPR-associated protein Cas1